MNLPGFEGALADEPDNIRFPGEVDAALDALKAFGDYCAADQKMRDYEKAGNHDEAIMIGIGYDPNSTNFYLSKFEDAIDRTYRINEEEMNKNIALAQEDLAQLTIWSLSVATIIFVLSYFGIRPRLTNTRRAYTDRKNIRGKSARRQKEPGTSAYIQSLTHLRMGSLASRFRHIN